MSRQDEIRNHLDHLRDAVPELKGVLLASAEGLPVAHILTNGLEPTRIAAMASASLKLGCRVTNTTGTGDFSEMELRGDNDMLLLYSTGSKAVLAVIAPIGSNIGLIHLEARDTVRAIQEPQ